MSENDEHAELDAIRARVEAFASVFSRGATDEKLREASARFVTDAYGDLRVLLAEVERLTAERDQYERLMLEHAQAEALLTAERDALRGALAELADSCDNGEGRCYICQYYREQHDPTCPVERARALLGDA